MKTFFKDQLQRIGIILIFACSALVLISDEVKDQNNGEPKLDENFKILIKEQPPKKLQKDGLWVLGHLHVNKIDKEKAENPHQILEIIMNSKDANFADYGIRRPDFNSDGYPDIEILQHGGAKWGFVHLWLYDPKKDKFHTNDVTRHFSKIKQASYRVDSKTKRIHVKKFHGANLIETVSQI